MRRLRTIALGTLVGAALAATSVTGCLLTSDFDGIAGTPPPPVVDAGDTSVVDATDPNTFPCLPGAHLICSNFDEGPLENSGWIADRNGPGSRAALDNTLFHSPSAAFHSTIGMAATGIKTGGILRQTPAIGVFKELIFAFDIRMIACMSQGSGGSITLAAIQPSDAIAFGIVLLDTNQYSFAEVDLKTGKFTPSPFNTQLKLNTWTRMTIKISLSTSAAHAVVTLDGATVVDADQTPGQASPSVLLNIGANATGPIAGCDVLYDNVTFDRN
jgi:hypothetical protein